jgi:quercetin dioxygenase-like cupin family protein
MYVKSLYIDLMRKATVHVWFLGQPLEVKVTGAQTGGAYAVTEAAPEPGFGPPAHVHHREDEAIYVVDGEFVVTIDGEDVAAGPGSLVHVAKGRVHTHRNVGPTPGRLVTVYVPAGFEQIFVDLGEPIADGAAGPSAPFDPQRLVERGADYGLEIVAG